MICHLADDLPLGGPRSIVLGPGRLQRGTQRAGGSAGARLQCAIRSRWTARRILEVGCGIALIIVVLALSLSAFGMAVTAVSRTMQQLNAIGSVGGFAMAMLGGAFVPVSAMPGWAQAIAPAMPTYWAMKGFRSVVLEGGGVGEIIVPLLVMTGFGVLFTLLVAAKFRLDDTKAYYG
jgi:hypothetical protein